MLRIVDKFHNKFVQVIYIAGAVLIDNCLYVSNPFIFVYSIHNLTESEHGRKFDKLHFDYCKNRANIFNFAFNNGKLFCDFNSHIYEFTYV